MWEPDQSHKLGGRVRFSGTQPHTTKRRDKSTGAPLQLPKLSSKQASPAGDAAILALTLRPVVRAARSHREGPQFESERVNQIRSRLAQGLERLSDKEKVHGSIPWSATKHVRG